MGKDVEHWGGNFGTRFSRESLCVHYRDVRHEERRIALDVGRISPANFSCDFNFGRGDTYFLNGGKVLEHDWSNYTEFDFSLASVRAEGGTWWPTFDGDHWNGGSSLVLPQGKHQLQHFEQLDSVCSFRVIFKGNLTCIFGVKVEAISTENGWSEFKGSLKEYPTLLELECGGETRLGHVSLTQGSVKDCKLAWDERSDMNGVAHKAIELVCGDFEGKELFNFYMAWKVEDQSDLKYFRIFKDEIFLGVSNTFVYVEKRTELKEV
jgi:hypothetical protein